MDIKNVKDSVFDPLNWPLGILCIYVSIKRYLLIYYISYNRKNKIDKKSKTTNIENHAGPRTNQ